MTIHQNTDGMIEMPTIPLFSSPVSLVTLNNNFDKLKEILVNSEYIRAGGGEVERTESVNILNHPDLKVEKKAIFDVTETYKNAVFSYMSTGMEITSSWGTRTYERCSGQFHYHANSLFSGILYFDDIPENHGGRLEFSSMSSPANAYHLEPTIVNEYNSKSFTVRPEKNLCVLFPSYLYHRIQRYIGKPTRYSLAWNVFPTNKFGSGDSVLNLSHQDL